MMDGVDDMDRMDRVDKTALFAPAEYWKLTTEQRAEICNGCGPRGIGALLVPDTVWGLSITPACNIHDYMYHAGWTIEDKKQADRVFLNNMIRIVTGRTRWCFLLRLRLNRVLTYYGAVKNFGGPFFWAHKNKDEEMGGGEGEKQ